MQVSTISNYGYVGNYQCNQTGSKGKNETGFSSTIENNESLVSDANSIPSQFIGMSFNDLFSTQGIKGNQIPVVNQVVSSKNPNDGEIYLTYFTDKKITCCHADGVKAWEMDIEEEQQEKVKDYFKEYKSYEWAKEIYSGKELGKASLKDYWMELFANKTE